MRIAREAWILGALLLIFVIASVYYSRRGEEEQQKGRPTTYSTGPKGTAALFRLTEREGLKAQRFEQDFRRLPDTAGLVVVTEPFQRRPTLEEESALAKWVENGGSLLYFLDEGVMILGDKKDDEPNVEAELKTSNPADVPVDREKSPLLRDVGVVHVDGLLRLKTTVSEKPVELVRDAEGPYAVTWKHGKGTVVVALTSLAMDNSRLQQADNALLFLNVAGQKTSPARSTVLFDEYHQGFGEEGETRGLWEAIGPVARGVVWYGLALFALLVYNSNRRLGTAKRLVIPTYRPSTEYIESMARLYRRAEAGDVALEILYRNFKRELTGRLELEPDARPADISSAAQRRLGWDPLALSGTLDRCEAAARGERIDQAEMMKIASQIEEYRRRAELVRPI